MTDKTISVYWFFILFIVAFAVVFIVYSLYGKPLDVRQMEGLFLEEKLADCVSRGGEIPETILDESGKFLITDENFLKKCGFNFNTEQIYDWNNNQLFVSLDFFSGGNSVLFKAGNGQLRTDSNVNVIDHIKKNQFPFCVERTVYSNGKDGKYYSIKVISCVRKTEKNV